MKTVSIIGMAAIAVIFSFTIPSTSQAAAPAVKCEAGKLKEAGKFANCRMKADSKAVKKDKTPDYTKCESKFSDKWSKAEIKADGACPSNNDEVAVEAAITSCMADVTNSLTQCGVAGGVEVGGACWFFGADDFSCDDTCNAVGLLYDDATRTYAGSDGSNANCEAVFDALGVGAGVVADTGVCKDGFGCVREFGVNRLRCAPLPATNSTAVSPGAEPVCACMPAP